MNLEECIKLLAEAQAEYHLAKNKLEDARNALADAEEMDRFPCGRPTHHQRRVDSYSEIDWVRGDRTEHGTA